MKMADRRISLDHGSGGKISHKLITDMMVPAFHNEMLARLDDGAVFPVGNRRLAFSTDTYVVDPIFFPGGNIGDLAVNGTVNDLAMCGAKPLYLSAGMVIEEGFPERDLERILRTMSHAADSAGVQVITGDTKVVPRGAADKIFLNTSGIGLIPEGVDISGRHARPGDKILLSGSIADHAVTILTKRAELGFEVSLKSDTAPLNRLVEVMLKACRGIHVLRDPTRGGVGTALNEIALQSRVGIKIHEDRIPVKNEVLGLCELLGFDPLYLANEGKLLAFAGPGDEENLLAAMRSDPVGREACVIGEVVEDHPGTVFMETRIGGERIVDMLTGEQLPRIC